MRLLKFSVVFLVAVVLISGCSTQQTKTSSQNNHTENKIEDKSKTGLIEENKV